MWGMLYMKDPLQLEKEKLNRCSLELLHFRRHRYLMHLCKKQPRVAMTAYHGLQEAVRECQHQMRFKRWDCTQNHTTRGTDYTLLHEPAIVRYGYQESAYLLAMSSAGVTWSIARSCAGGQLAACACVTHQSSSQQDWEWGGCSYNVKYGLVTSRRILAKGGAVARKGLLKKIHRHNLKAGRLAVKKTISKACKCHGLSGSCQIKTCWKAAGNLKEIGAHLTKKLSRAKNVLHRNSPNDSRKMLVASKPADLVYIERSPSYCRAIEHLRVLGTTNRTCRVQNATHSTGDCGDLCCGRGFTTFRQNYTENCNCRFEWCCHVKCEKCAKHRMLSVCS